jgi:hypothetical protein
MPQLFSPRFVFVLKLSLLALVFAVIVLIVITWRFAVAASPWRGGVGAPVDQVVPFSHEHHAGGLGIDCRYCHTTVEFAASAGMPPTETCMTCHSQIWREAPMLAPVRRSLINRKPLVWRRVYQLPGYVYFNHSIHVQKGIGCVSCHGRVDRMPLTHKAESLTMRWCLECHRHPERHVRPRDKVFDLAWQPRDQATLGPALVKRYHIATDHLTDCSICHR